MGCCSLRAIGMLLRVGLLLLSRGEAFLVSPHGRCNVSPRRTPVGHASASVTLAPPDSVPFIASAHDNSVEERASLRTDTTERDGDGDDDDDDYEERFSVAPMMGHTHRHFRYFWRLLSHHSYLCPAHAVAGRPTRCARGYRRTGDPPRVE